MRFLLVDQILSSVPGEMISGLKLVSADDFYLQRNDDGQWEFIPALMGEVLGQLAAWNVMQWNGFTARPVAGVVARASVLKAIWPGDSVFLQAFIERLDDTAVQYQAVASVAGEPVFKVEGALGPLLPMEQFIDVVQVRAQFDQIYRPAERPEVQHGCAVEDRQPQTVMAPSGYDQLLAFEAGDSMSMFKHINSQAPYFADHFPKKPVLPMTILLQSKIAMASHFLKKSGLSAIWQLESLQRIKMNEFVQPGETVITFLKVKSHHSSELVLSFRSEVRGKRVCVLEAVYQNRES